MKSKKILLLFLVVVLSVTMAAVSVACNNKTIELASLEGLDAEIDLDNNTVKVTVDSSLSVLALPKPVLTEEGEIGYEYYRDSLLKNIVESDTVELVYGDNIFYLKVYFAKSPKKFVKYCVIVTRPQPQTPDNGGGRQYGPFDDVFDGVFDFTDSGKPYPSATDISLEEFCALLKPYYVSATVARGVSEADALKKFDAAKNDGDFDEVPEMLSASGVTLESLTDVFVYGEGVWAKILPLITKFSAENADIFEIITEDVADETLIAEVFDFMGYAVDNIADENTLTAFASTLCLLLIDTNNDPYYSSNSYRKMEKEEFYALLEKYGYLDEYNEALQTGDIVLESFYEVIYSAEIRKCAEGVIQGLLNLSEYSPDKIASALKTVSASVGLVMNNDVTLNELLSGNALPIAEIVKSVNEAGEILYAFLDGLGDMNEFSKSFVDFAEAFSRFAEDDVFSMFGGIPGVLSFIAEVFSELKAEDYIKLYFNFDDFYKEKDDEAKEKKFGYFIASAANYLSEAYSHLGYGAKSTTLYLIKLFGLLPETVDVADLDEFMEYASSKPEDDLTEEECASLSSAFYETFMEETSSLSNFGYHPVIVPLGASVEAVTEALERTDEYMYVLMEAIRNNVEKVTLSCDTSVKGYCDLIVYFDGVPSYKTQLFVFDPADIENGTTQLVSVNLNRIIYASCELGGSVSVSDITDTISWMAHLFVKDEYYFVSASKLLNFDDVEFIGVDSSVAGVEKTAKVRVGTYGGFGDMEFVIVYYVYDENNPVITGATVSINHYIVPVGASVEDLGVTANYVYDYGFNHNYYGADSICPFEAEFSSEAPGKSEVVVTYYINGIKHTYKDTVTVISEDEYYTIQAGYWDAYAEVSNESAQLIEKLNAYCIVIDESATEADLIGKCEISFYVSIPFAWNKYGSVHFGEITYSKLKNLLEKSGYSIVTDFENGSDTEGMLKELNISICDPDGNAVYSFHNVCRYVRIDNINELLPEEEWDAPDAYITEITLTEGLTGDAFVGEVIEELNNGYFYWTIKYRYNSDNVVGNMYGLEEALSASGHALGAEIVTPATAGGVGRVALTIVDSAGVRLGRVYELDYRYAA